MFNLAGYISFIGEATVAGLTMLICPWRFRYRDCMLAFRRAAYDGTPVCAGVGFLLGVVLSFQSAAALQMFGVEVYVSDMLTLGLFRELGPLVTAIVLAGRSGSAFAAELGTMKTNEEIDALKTMGLEPMRFLVLPRIVAAVLAMPILTIFSEIAGLVGGFGVLSIMNVPLAVSWTHAVETATPFMIVFGLGKACLFGLIAAVIGCRSGLETQGTADGVGIAATSAVVGSIVAIAIADGLLALGCYLLGV